MSNAVAIKRFLQPLLARNPDLSAVGHRVVLRPLDHLIRSISLMRTRTAESFIPVWSINALCQPRSFCPYQIESEIKLDRYGGWQIDSSEMGAEFADCVEKQALPHLRGVRSLEDMYEACAAIQWSNWGAYAAPLSRMYVDAATGRFDEAIAFIERFKERSSEWSKMTITPEHFSVLTDVLQPALRHRHNKVVAALFRDWEGFTVRQLKLEKLWQPTPFPFEIETR